MRVFLSLRHQTPRSRIEEALVCRRSGRNADRRPLGQPEHGGLDCLCGVLASGERAETPAREPEAAEDESWSVGLHVSQMGFTAKPEHQWQFILAALAHA